jgi:phosphoglycolate phosphatase-like HAD superfamily hydrolase
MATAPNSSREHGEQPRIASEDVREFMRMEFQQNFEQLRDRDQHIIGMTKFFATLFLSVATVASGLLGLSIFSASQKWSAVGVLLLVTCCIGEMLFLWLVTFREYFVVCARQLNAIRHWYVSQLPLSQRDVAVQPVDCELPQVIHLKSAQFYVWLISLALILTCSTLGMIFLMSGLGVPTNLVVAGTFVFSAGLVACNASFLRSKYESTKRSTVVVDIDNTIVSDKRRKAAILLKYFSREVDDDTLRTDYSLKTVLTEDERAEFRRLFNQSEFVHLDEPIAGALDVLQRVSQCCRIVYLTTRPEYLRDATVERLVDLGFPLGRPFTEHLIMKNTPEEDDQTFKNRILVKLVGRRRIVAGIGDSPSDYAAYASVGIQPVCILSYWTPEEILEATGKMTGQVAFVKDWDEIERRLSVLVHRGVKSAKRESQSSPDSNRVWSNLKRGG